MNFLGMGPMELMMILVLALIIFGPGKLPEIAGQVGKVIRDFRRTTSELSSEFSRTLSLEVEERRVADTPAPAPEAYQPPPPVESVASTEVIAPPVESSLAPPAEVASAPAVGAAPGSARRSFDPDLAPPY